MKKLRLEKNRNSVKGVRVFIKKEKEGGKEKTKTRRDNFGKASAIKAGGKALYHPVIHIIPANYSLEAKKKKINITEFHHLLNPEPVNGA